VIGEVKLCFCPARGHATRKERLHYSSDAPLLLVKIRDENNQVKFRVRGKEMYWLIVLAYGCLVILHVVLTHKLQLIGWRPSGLRKAQTSFDALQILPGHLVTHDMCRVLIAFMQLFSRTSLVNAHHGDTDGPCRLTNTKT
jgi:hypothetical protein